MCILMELSLIKRQSTLHAFSIVAPESLSEDVMFRRELIKHLWVRLMTINISAMYW